MYQSPIKCLITHSNAFPLYLNDHNPGIHDSSKTTQLSTMPDRCEMNRWLHLLQILRGRSSKQPAVESVTHVYGFTFRKIECSVVPTEEGRRHKLRLRPRAGHLTWQHFWPCDHFMGWCNPRQCCIVGNSGDYRKGLWNCDQYACSQRDIACYVWWWYYWYEQGSRRWWLSCIVNER